MFERSSSMNSEYMSPMAGVASELLIALLDLCQSTVGVICSESPSSINI